MDISLDESQRLLANSARSVLAPAAQTTELRAAERSDDGFDTGLWQHVVDLGWVGLPFDPAQGGGGGRLVDAGVLAVELGRSAVALPLLATLSAGIVADHLRVTSGDLDLVAEVASGRRAACVDPTDRFSGPASLAGDRITGGPWIVEWAHGAELLVLPVIDQAGANRVVVAPSSGLSIRPVASTDNERIAIVTAHGCTASVIGEPADADALADASASVALLRSAALVGTAERVLRLTVNHVTTREQFGQPLGRFQAVQHRCADMAIHADVARLAVFHALARTAASRRWRIDAAVASFLAAQAAEAIVIDAAQLHGGLGFMQEYELSFHFRRAKAAQLRDGGEDGQLDRITEHLPELITSGWAGA